MVCGKQRRLGAQVPDDVKDVIDDDDAQVLVTCLGML
jgi:hypothetical protein